MHNILYTAWPDDRSLIGNRIKLACSPRTATRHETGHALYSYRCRAFLWTDYVTRKSKRTINQGHINVVANAPGQFQTYEMNMVNLRRNVYTTLDFDELKDRLKRKVGANYKLGHIGNEEISLYYLKDRYTENGLDRVPTCKLEIKNEKQEDGRIRIKFFIAEFSAILVGLIPVVFMLVFYFAKAPIPFYYASGLYPVLYFVLGFILTDQADKFETDLKELENGKNKLV